MADLVEAEMRKVCVRGHSLGWRPWYRSHAGVMLGHCLCGAPYRMESRGPEPLHRRALAAAGDWVAIEFTGIVPPERAEEIARVAVRAYLNEAPGAGT
jgi:hypothetical protein